MTISTRPLATAAFSWVVDISAAIRLFGIRAWLAAGVSAAATLILIGIPTEIINNPLFTRMTPVRAQDYAIWAATAMLVGLVVGTYAVYRPAGSEGKVLSGGLLSFLAVGCAVCNKLVVLLLGTSGALTFFAPTQLYIGLASLALLVWTMRLRARALTGACATDTRTSNLEAY